MNDLQTIQNKLLKDIFAAKPTNQFEKRGLDVYRTNLRATATRALSITFPTLIKLIGEPLIAHVAEKLLISTPPNEGNWSVWGDQLPDLLATLPSLSEFPFVKDVAELDYNCHQMVRKANATVDFQSLRLMGLHAPEKLFITCNPQLIIMVSEYPLIEIRKAHEHPTENNIKAMHLAIANKVPLYYLACYRNNFEVVIQHLSKIEYEWLVAIRKMSLGDALTAFHNKEFSFQIWLEGAIKNNLLYKINLKTIGVT